MLHVVNKFSRPPSGVNSESADQRLAKSVSSNPAHFEIIRGEIERPRFLSIINLGFLNYLLQLRYFSFARQDHQRLASVT